MKSSHKFINELECAIDCFHPVLKCLQIKEGPNEMPVPLSLFSDLKTIDSIKKWDIVLLIAELDKYNSKANFVLKTNDGVSMRCYIVIDKTYFLDNVYTKVVNETRVTIFMHEFMHFLSYLYARINNTLAIFTEILKKRLSEKVDKLNNKQVQELQHFFNKIKPIDDFTESEYTEDKHFRLGKEDTPLNYSDLYRNFLLSHQLFDEYFSEEDKDKFRDLWLKEDYAEAINLYKGIAKKIAQEEWITENFAIHQAFNILKEYYAYELL